jgi:CMP-N-acetylneuraminic acid synthetase
MLKHELPESRIQDIDTEEDWKVAEQKYRLLRA